MSFKELLTLQYKGLYFISIERQFDKSVSIYIVALSETNSLPPQYWCSGVIRHASQCDHSTGKSVNFSIKLQEEWLHHSDIRGGFNCTHAVQMATWNQTWAWIKILAMCGEREKERKRDKERERKRERETGRKRERGEREEKREREREKLISTYHSTCIPPNLPSLHKDYSLWSFQIC